MPRISAEVSFLLPGVKVLREFVDPKNQGVKGLQSPQSLKMATEVRKNVGVGAREGDELWSTEKILKS